MAALPAICGANPTTGCRITTTTRGVTCIRIRIRHANEARGTTRLRTAQWARLTIAGLRNARSACAIHTEFTGGAIRICNTRDRCATAIASAARTASIATNDDSVIAGAHRNQCAERENGFQDGASQGCHKKHFLSAPASRRRVIDYLCMGGRHFAGPCKNRHRVEVHALRTRAASGERGFRSKNTAASAFASSTRPSLHNASTRAAALSSRNFCPSASAA